MSKRIRVVAGLLAAVAVGIIIGLALSGTTLIVTHEHHAQPAYRAPCIGLSCSGHVGVGGDGGHIGP